MRFTSTDVSFYAFFFGLRQAELKYLRQLIRSFPYFDSHVLNVVDMSAAVKSLVLEQPEALDITWRSRLLNPVRDIDDDELASVFEEYEHRINRIQPRRRLFHGEAIDWVIGEFANTEFVVVMDSDIRFKNRNYLADVLENCNRYPHDLAAIGMLYQKHPFYLTLHPRWGASIYRLFVSANERDVSLTTIIKVLLRQFVGRRRNRDNLSELPRLHPALLLVNASMFRECDMTFRNLYLDVVSMNSSGARHEMIFGDNGASFLFQCSLAGKRIVAIDYDRYIDHAYRGARNGGTPGKTLSWQQGTLMNQASEPE